MVEEVLHHLRPRPGGRYVDGTLGDGGHTERILACHPSIEVLGLDRDPLSIAATARRLASFGPRLHTHLGNYSDLGAALAARGWERTDGIVLDLGVSSRQLDDPGRGFSFRAAGPLDMRMTPTGEQSAAGIVATASERELTELFRRYGEEPAARRIARAIVQHRDTEPITDTATLADIVARAVPRRGTLHPATRIFQALRIAVNEEITHLERFLAHALDWLAPAGRLVVIAYHSLEDRAVKQAMRSWTGRCTCPPEAPQCTCEARARVTLLTRKVVTPSADEVLENRRARSARLRAAEVLP
jgi:16S rRNA (cytosine1402-N4)-methyltransferase